MLQKNMLTASGEKRSIHVWVFLCYNLEQCRICTITDVKECWCFWCWLFFVLQNLQKRIQIIVFCLGHVSFNLYVECRKFWAIQIYFDMKRIAANMIRWNIIVIECYLNSGFINCYHTIINSILSNEVSSGQKTWLDKCF